MCCIPSLRALATFCVSSSSKSMAFKPWLNILFKPAVFLNTLTISSLFLKTQYNP